MALGNSVVDALYWAEGWGRALSLKRLGEARANCLLAWLGLVVAIAVTARFYVVLNSDAKWAHFWGILILDGGFASCSLAIILLRPVEMALSRQEAADDGEDSNILLTAADDSADSPEKDQLEERPQRNEGETTYLCDRASHRSTSHPSHSIAKEELPSCDNFINFHCTIFLLSVLSSVVSDCWASYYDNEQELFRSWSVALSTACFFIADLAENVLHSAAFLWLSVSYRILALRVWNLRNLIRQRTGGDRSFWDSRNSVQPYQNPKTTFDTVAQVRESYEAAFEAAEGLSGRTVLLTLGAVALAVVQLVATVQGMFERGDWKFDNTHMATLRVVIVLIVLLAQLALAAADIMFASERLVESMAVLEGLLRCQIGEMTVHNQSSYGSSNDDATREELRAIADLLKTVGFRARNFPVRISLAWFHLTTEWAMGIVLLGATSLLAVAGVKLPGGD